jgi:hypothetical protein
MKAEKAGERVILPLRVWYGSVEALDEFVAAFGRSLELSYV